jgi:hypothetical protein
LSALAVPHARASEATEGHAGKRGAGLEEVGVRTEEDLRARAVQPTQGEEGSTWGAHVGHHRARAGAGDEDPVGVGAVPRDRELRGGHDPLRVASAAVRERGGGVHVPASAAQLDPEHERDIRYEAG